MAGGRGEKDGKTIIASLVESPLYGRLSFFDSFFTCPHLEGLTYAVHAAFSNALRVCVSPREGKRGYSAAQAISSSIRPLLCSLLRPRSVYPGPLNHHRAGGHASEIDLGVRSDASFTDRDSLCHSIYSRRGGGDDAASVSSRCCP